MKRKICLGSLLLILVISCRMTTTTPVMTATPAGQLIPSTPVTTTAAPAEEALAPFVIDWTEPFAGEFSMEGEKLALTVWTPQPYAGKSIPLPVTLSQVINPQTLDGLTADQKAFLAKNGFVVIHSQEAQFGDIRVETARRSGQPYYLTTDAGFHALHLLFDDLLKSLEREAFRPQMIAITKAVLEQVRSDLPQVKGTTVEADSQQALAYLSVALKLFDPAADIDPSVSDLVSRQVDQILAGGGRAPSLLFPDFEDDYGAYKPVGHYAGDPDLEAYFRGMTWYGRMHFLLENPEKPDFKPSRVPLIVTLALRRAQIDGAPASDAWADVHKTLTFVIGPSDDPGPLEYTELMTQVYGANPTIQNLADEALWQDFLARTDQLPVPQINSLFLDSTMDLTPTKGWRFMGQRFTLDGMIFQNVMFDRVKERADGARRTLPSGLDVMSAFGSSPAAQELEKLGIPSFPQYPEQMEKMKQAVSAQPEEQWLGRFYDGWLYSFLPVVQSKDSAYPAYMQSAAWSYKDLNAALGSWAELKHDTILYTKMPEGAGGGGPPMSEPAPSYVEPNPQAFYRLAYMARTLACGLQNLVRHEPCDPNNGFEYTDVAGYITSMGRLGERFQTLGDIAAKELADTPLDEDERDIITDCLGMTECLNVASPYSQPNGEMPKVPVIAAVSGAQDKVLEAGVGNVDRIYVVVPLEDKWEIAQGGVFSYYEFPQPRDQRLTDDEWRSKLASNNVQLPAWAANFVLPGGQPKEVLFFRVGDVYIITEAGDKLNVRSEPSTKGRILTQFKTGDYVEIADGPVQADGYTWWKFKLGLSESEAGWAVESQEWYARSYLP